MKKCLPYLLLSLLLMASTVSCTSPAPKEEGNKNTSPPFKLNRLKAVKLESGATAYNPVNPYGIFINYELGMHCVGFDITYCCVIPPYNSIQAQAVRTGEDGDLPHMLTPEDGLKLHYSVRDNSYSEGNKMRYWNVPKDVLGNGKMDDPGDNMANYVWTHLFIYKDLEGTIPEGWSESQRLSVGKQIQVPIDSGPTGQSLSGGDLVYAGPAGGNKVFTDTLVPDVKNVPLTLTASYLWDALGLPLTAFYDSTRKGTIRSITQKDFQPYQYSEVKLRDKNDKPLMIDGKNVEFFGTNPVDVPNCYVCHSGQGKAAKMAKEEGLTLSEKEYAYWKNNYPDASEFTARQAQASSNILEIHDKHHGTSLLKEYNPDASYNRLGSVGSVYCADCHGDNVSGNLQSPRPGATGYQAVKGPTLTEAVHSVHAVQIPMPDKAGRTQNCQACHPTHWWKGEMNVPDSNPYEIVDQDGNPQFSGSDVRIAGGGCYLRRDAHTNPDVEPPFFLNEIGKWYLNEVSMKDENGKEVSELRGLYCTNCHNNLTHELYKHDNLTNPAMQEGTTLRNAPLTAVVKAVSNGDEAAFKDYYADPVVGADGDPLKSYYAEHTGATLVKATKDSEGKLKLLAWNAKEGDAVPYDGASAGKDWWLAAGEPHCADCHLAPFVESLGGSYFPVDQPNKYSLYRYSKAHGEVACQSCHESIHGLYPVRYEGPDKTPDMTSHEQALQFSPDGKYAGPVTCAACHTVNTKGVPVQLEGTGYAGDYWASVTLMHFMREGDQELPIADLTKKYPHEKARDIVTRGWK